MDAPKISWQVYEEISPDGSAEYIQYKTYTEEGSHIPGSTIIRNIRVWNNYMGTDNIGDALNCNLILSFKNFEDNFLLNLITITINNEEHKLDIDNNGGMIFIGDLSGVANSGSSMNYSNYKEFQLKIGPIPNNIRAELKNLYFYLNFNTLDA